MISKCCPRIKLVFLPVRSPQLNLIEVRWSWLQRQTLTIKFKDEQEIGRAVSKWKNIYNKNMVEQTQLFYRKMYPCVYTTVRKNL
ncbi:MAG TPA: transposase [Candidatus Nitrosocosmicus sp.]